MCIKNNIKNIYLFPFVFQKFLSKFSNYSFHQCYIFFPDPWPKKKHNKRRLVTYEFLKDLFSRCLRKGTIFIASDNLDYFKSVKKHVNTLKKEIKFSVKFSKKTPTIVTKYHNRAIKLKNNINFLKIDKI
jgi:tRNA (guanine-N7-)-methyltransferase